MCEIIQLKLKEYDVALKEKELLQETLLQNQFLNQTLNQISDGYIFVNTDGTIRNYNTPALRILGVTADKIRQQTIYSLIPDPALTNLFDKKTHTIYEQIFIHNKKYGIIISFFYNEEEPMGCSINFKAIDNWGTRVESLYNASINTTITMDDYLGSCKEMLKVKKLARKTIVQPVNVLISGENGTGKERLARAIHGSSDRAQNPFVMVDCQALSAEEMNKELFGDVEPSDSSSNRQIMGKIELARTGTLFINNVEQLPLYSQLKLLSCIRNHSFIKNGSNQKITIDIRIIAATTQNLEKCIAEGIFLEELYYFLNGVPIQLPPLRERGTDIMLYANYILKKYEKYFTDKSFRFDKKISLYFSQYSWPGNLHEMENVVQYMLSIHDGKGSLLTPGNLPANIKESFEHFDVPKKIAQTVHTEQNKSLRSIENQTISELLSQYGDSTSDKKIVAQKLGISLATLYRRLRENQ